MRKSEKQGMNAVLKLSEHKRKRADELDDDVDALFRLPLAEFTTARNMLAAKLKKNARSDDAARVKALTKPPISAWAVNQLYWNYREAFDRLIASGERFHKAQTSGKIADMRAALETRREVLSQLSDIAASVLRDASHNPSLDTIHRITTTLEGMSVYASRADGPRPGRLTHDVDPPGFESFGSFVPRMRLVPAAVAGGSTSARPKQTPPPAAASDTNLPTTNSSRKIATHDDARQLEEKGKTRIAAAKVSLQDAKRSLTKARVRAQSLEADQKKADAAAKKAEKHRRDADEDLRKAKARAEDAAQLARRVAAELEDAESAVDHSERTLEQASKELESLSREASGK
jgi:flagellar hook-associated protein FlgK